MKTALIFSILLAATLANAKGLSVKSYEITVQGPCAKVLKVTQLGGKTDKQSVQCLEEIVAQNDKSCTIQVNCLYERQSKKQN
jgi:hypothetical protein